MTSNEAAIAMWLRGFSVIPVPAPGNGRDGKRPSMEWKPFQQRRPTWREIDEWFSGAATNYAVITGWVSGVVVVDIDDTSALPWVRANLSRTPWTVKTVRGWHCYYRHPGELVKNRARLHGTKLDVRGDGGYVIGPGSAHASGGRYRATGDWRAHRREVPIFDPSLLAPPMPPSPPLRHPAPSGDIEDRARRFLSRIPVPRVGEGSDTITFRVACKLVRGFGLDPESVVSLLEAWSPGFDRWWIAAKVASALANGTESIGGRR